MPKIGLTILPLFGLVPDAFGCSYDGETYEYWEEFRGEITPELEIARRNTINIFKVLSSKVRAEDKVRIDENRIEIRAKIGHYEAVFISLMELLGQATAMGIIPFQVAAYVYSAVQLPLETELALPPKEV